MDNYKVLKSIKKLFFFSDQPNVLGFAQDCSEVLSKFFRCFVALSCSLAFFFSSKEKETKKKA